MRFLLILYLFYESILPAILLFPLWFLYMKEWMEEKAIGKEQEFRRQFRDSIQTMAGALKAGYSVDVYKRQIRYRFAVQVSYSVLSILFSFLQRILILSKRVRQEEEDLLILSFPSLIRSIWTIFRTITVLLTSVIHFWRISMARTSSICWRHWISGICSWLLMEQRFWTEEKNLYDRWMRLFQRFISVWQAGKNGCHWLMNRCV